jgi:DNA replication initiation complex subunit (GINS family)
MSSNNISPTIAQDLYKKQEKVIEELRSNISEQQKIIQQQRQRIEYLEEIKADYYDLKGKLGKNTQLYNQLVQPLD